MQRKKSEHRKPMIAEFRQPDLVFYPNMSPLEVTSEKSKASASSDGR